MELKTELFGELVKKGYAECGDGRRVWDVANRGLLYKTDEQAKAFLKLRDHPRYRATIINIEIDLLKKMAGKFVKKVGDRPCNLIDMGCGDGKKAKEFISILGGVGDIRYCPASPNKMLVKLALDNVKEKGFDNVKDYKEFVGGLRFLHNIIESVRDEGRDRNVVLLLGNILASFDIHDYLFHLSNSMKQGDCLVIGKSNREKNKRRHLAAHIIRYRNNSNIFPNRNTNNDRCMDLGLSNWNKTNPISKLIFYFLFYTTNNSLLLILVSHYLYLSKIHFTKLF